MTDYLVHHGILGQKWGVRRYQNKDGTLTPRGKERYSSEDEDKVSSNELENQRRRKQKEVVGKIAVGVALAGIAAATTYAVVKSKNSSKPSGTLNFGNVDELTDMTVFAKQERAVNEAIGEVKALEISEKKIGPSSLKVDVEALKNAGNSVGTPVVSRSEHAANKETQTLKLIPAATSSKDDAKVIKEAVDTVKSLRVSKSNNSEYSPKLTLNPSAKPVSSKDAEKVLSELKKAASSSSSSVDLSSIDELTKKYLNRK